MSRLTFMFEDLVKALGELTPDPAEGPVVLDLPAGMFDGVRREIENHLSHAVAGDDRFEVGGLVVRRAARP